MSSYPVVHTEPGLQAAAEHIFSMGLTDSAARLALANMVYGMAKINHVLTELNYPADTTFIATPDLTITRNTGRWRAGFGYGGKLQWGDGDRPLLVLDVKPNGCGMLVGGLAKLPDPQTIVERLDVLKGQRINLMGVDVEWDFGVSNHFIDLCRLTPAQPGVELAPYAFVIHGSCPELHSETLLGPGCYWNASPTLAQQARVFTTPWGELHVLLDEHADAFMDFWRRADDFAKQRRLLAAQHCFGEFSLLANTTHQGMWDRNTVLLGCQDTLDPSARYFPIMVRGDLPGYLFEGLPNLTEGALDDLGFRERGERLGVIHRLRAANVIPHGAGYALPHLRDLARVITVGDRRYFEVTSAEDQATEIVEDFHETQQKYRGRQPVLKTLECGLGRLAATLTPLHVVKA
jgi:hypothetical protein